jgi:UDP-glucose 4-epimerase
MHILITGGAGFIGSHLAECLLAHGHTLALLDDFSTGREGNLAAIAQRSDVQLYRGDIRDAAIVAKAMRSAEAVVHLAAAVGAELVMRSPARTLAVNVAGTECVLNAAHDAKALVFLASSSEVYGRGGNGIQSEGDDLGFGPSTSPRWGYACSKAMDEWLAFAHANEHATRVIVGRIFNTTGPRQLGDYGMVLPRFVRAALRNEPVRIHGQGTQTRSFIHVQDTVEAIRLLLSTRAAVGEVVNIGRAEEVSIHELALRVLRETSSDSPVEFVSEQQARQEGYEDLPRRRPSTEKLFQLTGFRATQDLAAIIRDCVREERRRG